MKELIQDRKDKCDKGHIIIDTEQKAIKCYTKASKLTRRGVVEAQEAVSPPKIDTSSSELFNFLGVDYVKV